MIFLHYNRHGFKRTADLSDICTGQTAILVGGAPTLKQQPLELLARRGVLTLAMNNAAMHFQPSLWCGVDRPECYEPQILLDPGIMKFGNYAHADTQLDGRYDARQYLAMPNMYFYLLEDNVQWDEYLATRKAVPWYNNTLFTSIYILYHLGIRRIILAGSDFGTAPDGSMYAHSTDLDNLQVKWNLDLYNSQVHELRRLKPVFDKAGLEFLDCSVNSRICQVYRKITMEQAVELCLERFPANPVDPSSLPHCSKFATVSIQDQIARWPGYKLIGGQPTEPSGNNDARKSVV